MSRWKLLAWKYSLIGAAPLAPDESPPLSIGVIIIFASDSDLAGSGYSSSVPAGSRDEDTYHRRLYLSCSTTPVEPKDQELWFWKAVESVLG